MTLILYALTFIPMALVTLVIHELGHLLTARALRVKVSGFQIGIGPTILTFYTGHTRVPLAPSSLVPGITPQLPAEGELASVYVSIDDLGQRQTLAVLPLASYKTQTAIQKSVHRHFSGNSMQLTGRVRQIAQDHIVLADVAWTLKAFPIMAAVYLPEDFSRRIPNLYNTTNWRSQMLITLAGPAANLFLFAAMILALATVPIPVNSTPVLAVTSVTNDSPALTAGFQQGDLIIQANTTLLPQHPDIAEFVHRAHADDTHITFHIHRGRENHTIRVTPSTNGRIGLTLAPATPDLSEQADSQPRSIPTKVFDLTTLYFESFAAFVSTESYSDSNTPLVMGPISTAYYTAQAVQYAKLKAWLAILAAITLGTALLNLIPVPPLDGYRMILNTIQALRSQPINPRLEQAIMYGGFAFLIFAGVYLLLYDILLILT